MLVENIHPILIYHFSLVSEVNFEELSVNSIQNVLPNLEKEKYIDLNLFIQCFLRFN